MFSRVFRVAAQQGAKNFSTSHQVNIEEMPIYTKSTISAKKWKEKLIAQPKEINLGIIITQ